MNDNPTQSAPGARKDVAPEIPPEVEKRMNTETKVWAEPGDPDGGGFHDPMNKLVKDIEVSARQVARVKKEIGAMCRKKEIAMGDDGLPAYRQLTATTHRKILEKQYPNSPTMDGELGDLTPAFVEWLYLNHPSDAAARYYARQTHLS